MSKARVISMTLAMVLLLGIIPPSVQAQAANIPQVSYSGHVQSIGDIPAQSNGQVLGTTGRSLRLEEITVSTTVGQIRASGHVQSIGDTTDVIGSTVTIGTRGRALRLESIRLSLEGAPGYALRYKVHQAGSGWSLWFGNDQWAGSKGQSIRIEAIQIEVVSIPAIRYSGHVQGIGDVPAVSSPNTLGTTGQSRRLEEITLSTTVGHIRARGHVQSIGDTSEVKGSTVTIGTRGRALRLESVVLSLENAPGYVLRYRVHQAGSGWSRWFGDNQWAGSKGQSIRIEAIQVEVISQSLLATLAPTPSTPVTPPPSSNAPSANAQAVVNETMRWVGSRTLPDGRNASGLCQAFVYQMVYRALRTSRVDDSRRTALDAWHSWGVSTSSNNIPVGAAVYFRVTNPAGHVGIHVGNGNIVHAWTDGIRIQHLSTMPGTYLGWGWQAGFPL